MLHQKGTMAPAPTPAPAAPGKQAPKPSGPMSRMADAAVASLKLETCQYCKRKFAGDRIAVHQNACRAKKSKKRPVYDSAKHRLSGTAAEPYLKLQGKKPVAKQQQHQTDNWKSEHEAMIDNMKGKGKPAQGPSVPAEYADYVQCPYCARRFNEAAAERHIPQCKDMVHNKTGKK